jgi:hypothetical protein
VSFLLDAHRAFTLEGGQELSPDCILRGTKAAELTLSLLTALGVGESTLNNARLLYPFFCFLMPPVRGLRASLPRRLRGYWDGLLTGELIAEREDLMHWQASVKIALNVFAEPPNGKLLPYPSVQVTANPDRSVYLTCLTGDGIVEEAVPSEISPGRATKCCCWDTSIPTAWR